MKPFMFWFVSLVFCHSVYASNPQKPQALVVISSARVLPLSSPIDTVNIPVGFFLVELAKMLQTFESEYDFVFVTPDGKKPQIDVNGFDLNFHVQGKSAPYLNAFANFRNTDKGSGTEVREILGINQTLQEVRKRRYGELKRRYGEVETAIKHLGNVQISNPLPNTAREAKYFKREVLNSFGAAESKKFMSLAEVIQRHRDPYDSFKLSNFDFVFVPGGHAPMVDLYHNPLLGEVFNVMFESGKLLALICHGPVALTSALYRVDEELYPIRLDEMPLRGTKVTTVSSFEEDLMLNIGYIKVPHESQETRLTYYVDNSLNQAGFDVVYGSKPINGIQLFPGSPKVVYDEESRVLTSNGPQAMDEMMDKMVDILEGTEK